MQVTSYPLIDILRFSQGKNTTYFAPAKTITEPLKNSEKCKSSFLSSLDSFSPAFLLEPYTGSYNGMILIPDITQHLK
jgi:hypothetical protein